MTKRLISGALLLAFLAVACSGGGADPSAVTFDVELIEIKGGTDGIAPPEVDPASLSLGYRYKGPGTVDPDNPDKWEVSTYMFAPGSMTVVDGDTVTLRMFGVNGDAHDIQVVAPDGSVVVDTFTINRGREYSVTFETDQTGHYKLLCYTHAPTMQADILSVGG